MLLLYVGLCLSCFKFCSENDIIVQVHLLFSINILLLQYDLLNCLFLSSFKYFGIFEKIAIDPVHTCPFQDSVYLLYFFIIIFLFYTLFKPIDSLPSVVPKPHDLDQCSIMELGNQVSHCFFIKRIF